MKKPKLFFRDKYGGPWNFLKIFPKGWEGLEATTAKSTPCLHRLLFGNVSEYFILRLFVGFCLGAFFGQVFYEMILVDLAFSKRTVYVLGAIFTSILAVGCALSSQIRCITFLTIPSFSSKAGRHIVQAWIIAIVIMGPVQNVFCNIQELMRMNSCSSSLANNLSEARYNLLVRPFKIAFLGTKMNTEELRDMLGSVDNVVEPFSQEIEGVDDVKYIQEENDYMDQEQNDTKRSDELKNKYKSLIKRRKREDDDETNQNASSMLINTLDKNSTEQKKMADEYQQKYLKKLETRCENVKTGMGRMCRERFAKFKANCEDAVHWSISWIVCWPMQLSIICDLVKVFTYGGYSCDPKQVVSGEIGNGYVKLLGAGKTMREGVAEERMQYKLKDPPNLVGVFSVITITKEFTHEIFTVKSYADAIVSVVKTVLAFMFILVISSAAKYHTSYIKTLDNDNVYITESFRVLDARRRISKKPTVLPLTKIEKNKLIDPYDLVLAKLEIKTWMTEFWTILAMIIVVTIVVFIDKSLTMALEWMRDNLAFSYMESGLHSFNVEVKGMGFVANIVRSIIKGFHFKKTLKGEVSNKHCLPHPKYMNKFFYIRLYSMCFFLVLMGLVGNYFRRLRRAICAYYYPEQEKQRIKTLYSKTLNYRKQLFDRQIEVLYKRASNIEIQSDLKCLWRLQKRYPRCFILRIIPSTRPRCAICEEEEALFLFWSTPYHRCEVCNSYYCKECWTNFSYSCYVCNASNKITKEVN